MNKYKIGDKIVYPMHGAGVIEAIEERDILGKTRDYYILNIPYGEMEIMIPCDAGESIGIRPVISSEKMQEVIEILTQDSTEMDPNWNRRYRENMDKLKTGEALFVAEVVRNLMRIDSVKKLSTGEKKMLSNAKQILISEFILVNNVDEKEATLLIERKVWKDGNF